MSATVAAAGQPHPDDPLVRMETAASGPSHAVSLPETPSETFTPSATVILGNRTIIALGQGWAVPAAKDFETRFSEGGLANVTFTDPRNFAHGRHNWLALHSADTAVVSLETQTSQAEAARILKFLPEGIDHLRVQSKRSGPAATIDLN